jgi:hypothetical protein
MRVLCKTRRCMDDCAGSSSVVRSLGHWRACTALNELDRLGTDKSHLASIGTRGDEPHLHRTRSRQKDADKLRITMKKEGLRKLPGESWIEVGGVMHTFRANDHSHPRDAANCSPE